MIETGKRYVVKKASDDGTFLVGDHISLSKDGSINCYEAHGWIEACEVSDAARGMEVEIDRRWAARRKQELLRELTALDDWVPTKSDVKGEHEG